MNREELLKLLESIVPDIPSEQVFSHIFSLDPLLVTDEMHNMCGHSQKVEQFLQKYFVYIESLNKPQLSLKNRVKCECQAQVHPLISNCLECGRVVCAVEGPGNCLFCNTWVGEIRDSTRKEKQIRKSYLKENPTSFQNAQLLTERLIEYDQNKTQRSRVFDLSSDYNLDDHHWDLPEIRNFKALKRIEKRQFEMDIKKQRFITIDLEKIGIIHHESEKVEFDWNKDVLKFENDLNKQNNLMMNDSEQKNKPHINHSKEQSTINMNDSKEQTTINMNDLGTNLYRNPFISSEKPQYIKP